jgi:hypothetical protein
VRRRARGAEAVVPEVLSCWLCHAGNISNPATRYVFPHALADVAAEVGAAAWGDTDAEVARLLDRLSAPG